MHISQTLQGLKADIPNLIMAQPAPILQQLKHIPMHILKHKIQQLVLLDNFQELHYIGMMQFQ